MAARDDPYRDDPYGEHRDGADDDARPGPRHATRPARPAWDAMTYGVPSDSRRATTPEAERPAEPDPYSFDLGTASGAEPEPLAEPAEPSPYLSQYSAAPTYTPPAYPTPDYSTPSYPAPSYPAASPASAYPGAADSYAPDAYTSYRAPMAPPAPPVVEEQPVYVAAGLYLDEPAEAAQPSYGYPADDHTATLPVAPPAPAQEVPAPSAPRSRRGLPAFGARVAVGVLLGAVVLASLLLWRPAFLALVAIAVGVGVWELVRAVQGTGANPPLIPLVVGSVLMIGLAWWGGIVGLTFGLAITVVATMAWRFASGVTDYGRDVSAATLVAVYVPFLAGFAALLGSPADGDRRVLATLIAVVLSDTGGYLVGALFGRHPMAPSVSPKKSWEGFGGSLLAAALGSGIVVWLMFDASFGAGLLFGVAICVASVIGDLGESLLKRDLGVKDMSSLLPGHGGLMDRLDSILFAAPTAYLMFAVLGI